MTRMPQFCGVIYFLHFYERQHCKGHLLNMSLHHSNATGRPLMLRDVTRIGQCENAVDIMVDFGGEEE